MLNGGHADVHAPPHRSPTTSHGVTRCSAHLDDGRYMPWRGSRRDTYASRSPLGGISVPPASSEGRGRPLILLNYCFYFDVYCSCSVARWRILSTHRPHFPSTRQSTIRSAGSTAFVHAFIGEQTGLDTLHAALDDAFVTPAPTCSPQHHRQHRGRGPSLVHRRPYPALSTPCAPREQRCGGDRGIRQGPAQAVVSLTPPSTVSPEPLDVDAGHVVLKEEERVSLAHPRGSPPRPGLDVVDVLDGSFFLSGVVRRCRLPRRRPAPDRLHQGRRRPGTPRRPTPSPTGAWERLADYVAKKSSPTTWRRTRLRGEEVVADYVIRNASRSKSRRRSRRRRRCPRSPPPNHS